MKKSWQNTVFLYIYQVVGVYGWELAIFFMFFDGHSGIDLPDG